MGFTFGPVLLFNRRDHATGNKRGHRKNVDLGQGSDNCRVASAWPWGGAPMKVLVTGGLGFIGVNLASYLRSEGSVSEISAVDWLEESTPAERAPFDHVSEGCFASREGLVMAEKADVVVHLAAQCSVQDSIADPAGTFFENVGKTETLLEHLRTNTPATRLIFASTAAVAGDHDGPISEATPPAPLSPYGASKLAVEGLLSAYRGSFGMKNVALRFSNVYGPNARRQGGVIPSFCRQLLADNRMTVNGDGEQTRDYIYVDDISAAISAVIRREAEGCYQLGTGVATSVLQLAGILADLAPSNAPRIEHAEALPGEVRHNCADITKAQAELGFEPQFDVKEGVARTFRWFEDMA